MYVDKRRGGKRKAQLTVTCVVISLLLLVGNWPLTARSAAPDAAPEAAQFKLTFGKHRGMRVSDLPKNYLEWLVREKVYTNRPELIAALCSLKMLNTTVDKFSPGMPALVQKPQLQAQPRQPSSHCQGISSKPRQQSQGGNNTSKPTPVGVGTGPASCQAGRNDGTSHRTTLDAFLQLPNATTTASEPVAASRAASSAEATEVASSCRRLSMELITPQHVAVYGVNAADGGTAHTSVLKLLRRFPYATYNASARGWSLRVQDYTRMVSALKTCGFSMNCHASKSTKGAASNLHVDRPPDSLVKVLQASSGPTLNASAADLLLSKIPSHLRSSLLPFQAEGVVFAVGRGGRCLLADEMGLGKTVQGIAVAAAFRSDWPLLIICPSSLRLNWKHELSRWLPGEEDVRLVLCGKDVEAILQSPVVPNITIISYDLLTSRARAARLQQRWHCIISDESHYIKNPKSLRTKACMPLLQQAQRALLISGTPALSRPCELFTQLHCLQPKMFPSKRAFESRYCDLRPGRFGADASGASNLQELNLVLAHTMMIRRLKRDVLTQLPSKRRQKVFVPLATRAAAALKKSLVLLDKLSLRSGAPNGRGGEGDTAEEPAGREDGGEGEGEGEGEAADDGAQRGRRGMRKREALLARVYQETGLAKLEGGVDYVLTLLEGGVDKLLVFAHHLAVLDGLQEAIAAKNIRYVRIDGSVPPAKRAAAVEEFQKSPHKVKMVAILGITAAGVGLTLTAASTVVFLELSWTPGLMVQAEDRVHRIGQRAACNIHYLLAEDSCDSHMWPSLVKKLRVVRFVHTCLRGCALWGMQLGDMPRRRRGCVRVTR